MKLNLEIHHHLGFEFAWQRNYYEHIIRNFENDKVSMREKVVNKTYCEFLPQIKK
ncbi:MAG: hypothetical protein LBT29_03050 [Flavobacteriaceae bacterium]|jgi:hypothetical protein|nr:hypothetical protein [Flavobacteriaceae bacterium]